MNRRQFAHKLACSASTFLAGTVAAIHLPSDPEKVVGELWPTETPYVGRVDWPPVADLQDTMFEQILNEEFLKLLNETDWSAFRPWDSPIAYTTHQP